jgi:hypothetical protein
MTYSKILESMMFQGPESIEDLGDERYHEDCYYIDGYYCAKHKTAGKPIFTNIFQNYEIAWTKGFQDGIGDLDSED